MLKTKLFFSLTMYNYFKVKFLSQSNIINGFDSQRSVKYEHWDKNTMERERESQTILGVSLSLKF